MKLATKIELLASMARWGLTWARRDLNYRPRMLQAAKFMSARQAVALIPDGAVVFSAGMASSQRNSVFFWAIRARLEGRGTPKGLTWITVGAQGGRGRFPAGTLEELDHPGLIVRYVGGHVETVKSILRRADEGYVKLHVMPQGVETFLLEAQARGEEAVVTRTGVGTFLDPRVGRGTAVLAGAGESFVEVADEAGDRLRYHLPSIDVSLFVAPAADAEGNIYMRHAPMYTESREASLAARRNGGKVLVSVAEIIAPCPSGIFLPAEAVDAIVVNPHSEQIAGVPQLHRLDFVTLEARVDPLDAIERLKFINDVLGVTPRRGPADLALARLAAALFTRVVPRGAVVNIGVGHPEEVSRLLCEAGAHGQVTFTTETGVCGGIPGPGIFFGAAVNPERFLTSAEMFHLYERELAATVLGLLQADADGNVNVSRRGEGAINYVGPGGFPDISTTARTVIFVGSWMAKARLTVANGRIGIARAGPHKFVPHVDEITFNGREALKRGQRVFFVTHVGVFRLTERGMELVEVMPGIDVRRDVLAGCPMKVVLPASGIVSVADESIVTGEGFRLRWT